MIEQTLNRHDSEIGYAHQSYFAFVFPDYVLQYELPRGYKIPKFSKFAGKLGESTIKLVARYQIECGDLAIDVFLTMKYFPSFFMKSVFTWFTTLPPNSIYTWAQLERVFHEHFFKGQTRVILIDLGHYEKI